MLNVIIQNPFVTMFSIAIIIALFVVGYGFVLIRRDELNAQKRAKGYK